MGKVKVRTAVGRFLEQLPDRFEKQAMLNSSHAVSVRDEMGESLIFELPSKKKVKFIAKLVEAKKCKIWKGNVRLQEFLNESNTEDLQEKIKVQGQLVPILARPIKDDPVYSHEVIYGSRRLYVCSLLGIKIKILEADLDDEDALLFMDAENAGREEVSAYEAAMAYKHWLEIGIFKSQGELSEKLGITRSWLNKTLSLTKIPKEIISAISGPSMLSLNQGLDLVKYLAIDALHTEELVKDIALNKKSLTIEQIVQILLDNEHSPIRSPIKTEYYSKIIFSKDGQPICKMKHSKQGRCILTFDANFSQSPGFLNEIEVIIKNNFSK